MSNNDSKDEETNRILNMVKAKKHTTSDDSKESSKSKNSYDNIDGEIQYETNTEETPDSEW